MATRRVGVALGLSVAAHALFIGLFLLLPGQHTPPRGTATRGGGPALCIRVQGWDAPRPRPRRPAPERPAEEFIAADIVPTLGAAPVLAPVAAGPEIGGGHDAGKGGGRRDVGRGGSGEGGLLATPGTVRRVVYVVDRSISMGLSEGLGRARTELAVALRALPPDALFQVLVYNRTAEPLLPRGLSGLALADPDTIEQALRRMDEVTASGATDHVGALRAGLGLRPEVLFLVTDADELTDADVRAITIRNQGRTAIHVVELARRRAGGDGPLARLAGRNRGTYRRVAPSP